MPQFFVNQNNINNSGFLLDEEESHHCSNVFRKKKGEQIALFDGKGGVYKGVITGLVKGGVYGSVISVENKKPQFDIDIFVPLIKGERFDWMLEKLTEIGACRIFPIITDRTEIKKTSDSKTVRWKKILLAAAKQSMSPILPEIYEPVLFNKAVQDYAYNQFHIFFWEKERNIFMDKAVMDYKGLNEKRPLALWVGPEGGFTLDEYTSAKKAGFIMCSLGANTLRAETACMAGLLLAQYELSKSNKS